MNVFFVPPTAWSTAMFSSVKRKEEEKEKKPASSSEWGPLPAEDAFVLEQYELHYLVLVDHVDRDVARLGLGPQQRGSEHDGHALGGHTVFLTVVDHSGGTRERGIIST